MDVLDKWAILVICLIDTEMTLIVQSVWYVLEEHIFSSKFLLGYTLEFENLNRIIFLYIWFALVPKIYIDTLEM